MNDAWHLESAYIRKLTSALPIPGRLVRRSVDRFAARIKYPEHPTRVRVRNGYGVIEVESFTEYIQQGIYFLGYHELRETKLVERLCTPGDTFVDVGANIGWFTLVASRRVGPSGRVIAFEPSYDIYARLQRTIGLNGLSNVTAERLALSDRSGISVLAKAAGNNSGIGSIVRQSSPTGNSETVETMDFWSYSEQKNLGRVRLVKIDVEGAELLVLRGMVPFLRAAMCDYVLMEIDAARLQKIGSNPSEVAQLFRSCGYKLQAIGTLRLHPVTSTEHVTLTNVLAAKI